VFLADTVLEADARITLASTGYQDDQGKKHGGTLSLIATPQGFSTAQTKELFLTGNTLLHLSPTAAASDLVKLDGRVTFNRSGSLRLQSDQILFEGGASESVLAGLSGSVASFDASKMELTDGTVLVLDAGSDAADQFSGVEQIALGSGSVGIEVPEGSSVSLATVFTGAGGLRKLGGGTLVVSGQQAYTGPTRVEAGTLLVTGSLTASSGVTVGGGTFGTAGSVAARTVALTTATTAGASLGGTGTVAGTVTVADGGTLFVGLEPGVIGSLTIGSLVFESGSTLALEASPTAADQLTVSDSLTIGEGASLRATLLDGLVLDTSLIVMVKVPGAGLVVGRFGSVTAVDEEGNEQIAGLMYAAGDGNDIALTSDVDPPTGGAVADGQSGDLDFQVSLTTIAAAWSGFTDGAGSGIAGYEWAIGTTPGGTDVMAFTAEGISGTSATRSGLSLTSGTTYYATVRAIDNAENVSTAVTSDGVMADAVAPTTGTVKDGATAGVDIAYQQALNALTATWSGFADGNGSGIDRYEWAIGTTPGGQDVLAYTTDGITGTSATKSGLSLTSGTTYYVSVRAIDKVQNVSTAVTSDGVMADSVAPTAGTVKDGPTAGIDIAYQQSATSFSANWSGFADVNGSGILRFRWAIGTTPGGTDVMAFRSVGTATTASATGLSLNDNVKYYVTVRAIDRARNVTNVFTDGVTVYSLPPVVTAANIRVAGGTAGGGAFKPLDTVTATWNDTPAGDNNSHLLGSVTIDFSRFGGPQSVPATLQNGIWTASYRIAAGFTGTNRNVAVTVIDLAGNSTTTSGTDNAMIAIPGGRADFTDSDGDRYRVQLTGPGLLAIDIDADGNGRGPIQRIQVAGTAPALSALNVALLGSARTSDKLVRIGSIAGTGLASISAAASNLVGAGVDLAGPLGSLVVRDVANGASIRAGGTAAHRTTIQARRIGAAGEIRLGSTLTNLVAEEVGAIRILAAAVGVLNATGNSQARPVVAGNFAANLDITGNVDTISVAGAVRGANWTIGGNLRSLTVRGAIDGLTMNVGGALTWARLGTVRGAAFNVGIRVASFTALTFTDSRLFVGYTPINPSDPMAGATSARFNRAIVTRIDSFSVTARTANAFAGSTIAARQIGTVSLSRVATANQSHFGVLADDSISSVVLEAPRLRVATRKAPCDLGRGQFRVRIV
jgi:autotransporter-associated beta strand protein